MRSLPFDSLIALIVDSIEKSTDLEFLNCVNIIINKANVLIAPSINDKILLLNVIKVLLHNINMKEDQIDNILSVLSSAYNISNIEYTKDSDINFFEVLSNGNYPAPNIIDYKTKENIIKYIKSNKKIPYNLYRLFKVQMFIYASIWFDMDKYLVYLYHKYK